MVQVAKILKISLTLLGIGCFAYLGTILPVMRTGLFASPDETAVRLFSEAWTADLGFRLPIKGDAITRTLAGLHPRSMVQQGEWLVPVGFLGMPFLIMITDRIVHGAGEYLTLLLVLSSFIPLLYLTKRFGVFVARSSVLIYACFPTVLLYVNRGFFPNLPVVALSLWSIALARMVLDERLARRVRDRMILSGLSTLSLGLALFIRPIEALWMLPWFGWAVWPYMKHSTITVREKKIAVGVSMVVLVLVAMLGVGLSMRTYPFNASIRQQPISGYQLKDALPLQSEPVVNANSEVSTRNLRSLIPFGVHPRVLWSNIRLFFFDAQGVWFGVAILGALLAWMSHRRRSVPILLLSAWTFISLLFMYGQISYMDNINGLPTLGNSFLRYTLPLVPLIAIGSAYAADVLRRVSRRGAVLAIGLTAFLACYGIAYALSGDQESILATRRELARYHQIYAMTDGVIPEHAIIISERSDKIFASGSWTVASPIPGVETLSVLRDAEAPVYLFHRLIQTDADAPKVISSVFSMIGDPIFQVDNEALYPLYGAPDESVTTSLSVPAASRQPPAASL